MATDFGYNPHVDDMAWSQGQTLRQGTRFVGDGNRFLEVAHAVNGEALGAGTERGVRETCVLQLVESDALAGVTHDVVGDDSRAVIGEGVKEGRAWGGYSDVVVSGDGLAIGRETAIFNHGTDQHLVDQPNSKYGHLVPSKGSVPATAAMWICGPGGWRMGIGARTDAFPARAGDHFLVLFREGTNDPVFRVDGGGNLTHVNGRRVLVKKIGGVDCLTLA